jgi:recombination protein RecR
MTQYSETIERLMQELGRLPGIGARTAERLTFYLLKAGDEEALGLAEAIRDLKTKIHPCKICFNPTEQDICNICSDNRRDKNILCVVEQPKDLLAIESTGMYRGVYHVLMGNIAPLDGIEAEDLTIDALIERVRAGEIREVILATNPTVAGDGTALHITSLLEPLGVRVTRLARGLPAGGQIEYANKSILSDALNERREI